MAIPLAIVTGFLGSGKSTLINKIIQHYKDLKIGLILNEFGDVQLESQIIEKSKEEEVVELDNGCMCCVSRGDILEAVDRLITSMKDIDYIIVEASGLSDPVPIAQTFLHNDMEGRIKLKSIMCVVDTTNFKKNSEEFEITIKQIQSADYMLISKTDIADKKTIKAVQDFILTVHEGSSIHDISEGIELDLLLDTSKFDHGNIKELEIEHHELEAHSDHSECDHEHGECKHHQQHQKKVTKHSHDHKHNEDEGHDHDHHECDEHCDHDHSHDHKHHHHHEHVETLFWKCDTPLDSDEFGRVAQNFPEGIVRGKGFCHFENPPVEGKKFVYQLVGSRNMFEIRDWKPKEKKQSALVLIGKEFDKDAVKKELDSTIYDAKRAAKNKKAKEAYAKHQAEQESSSDNGNNKNDQ